LGGGYRPMSFGEKYEIGNKKSGHIVKEKGRKKEG
jgi:hypothetical protein